MTSFFIKSTGGASLCIPHFCHHLKHMYTLGMHGLSCHFSAGHHFHYAIPNDSFHRGVSSAIPPLMHDWSWGKPSQWNNHASLLKWQTINGVGIWTLLPLPFIQFVLQSECNCNPGSAEQDTEVLLPHMHTTVAFETTEVYGPCSMSFLTHVGCHIPTPLETKKNNLLAYLLQ